MYIYYLFNPNESHELYTEISGVLLQWTIQLRVFIHDANPRIFKKIIAFLINVDTRSLSESPFQLLTEMQNIKERGALIKVMNEHLKMTYFYQSFHLVHNHWLVTKLNQRFRDGKCERSKSCSISTHKNQGLHFVWSAKGYRNKTT